MSFSFKRLAECARSKTGDSHAKLTNMKSCFNDEKMALVARKIVYRYEFIDEHAKVTYKGLPHMEASYSKVRL
jgi:hypothetical protein